MGMFQAGDIFRSAFSNDLSPGLTAFRRTAVWMPGEYILLLDDIKAESDRDITWRGVVEKGTAGKNGECVIETNSGKKMNLQVLANRPVDATVAPAKDLNQPRCAAG